ncbi:MAG: glycosyltransferase [Thiolinea sp.]
MKKIAVVIAELGMPGGAEKVAADLALEFQRRQYEVTIIKFDRSLPGEQLHELPCRIIDIQVPERKGSLLVQLAILSQRAWRFRRIFRREQFDHIFSFLEAANLPTVLASSRAVLSMHLDPGVLTRKE